MGRLAMAELIIHLQNFSVPRHTPHLLHLIAWILERGCRFHFFKKKGISMALLYPSSIDYNGD